ncbi:hypothetical protein FHR34_002175 [Kitasatospora kifunensis]|uniref:Uncharacterized protein n=1 Tax=Kitasatospora kifunensis TaxID=58351 RepID=A0A7W7R0H2_KITKI|nr:hypothetical protein [Kitasatospora kifunensis]
MTRDSSAAVSAARCRSEEISRSGRRPASSLAARLAWSRPTSVSGMSVLPWNRDSRFQEVWPCRQKTIRGPPARLLS